MANVFDLKVTPEDVRATANWGKTKKKVSERERVRV